MDFHGTLSLSHGLPIGFAAKTNVRGLSWPPTMLGLELVLSNDVLLQYDLYIYICTVDICGNYKKLDLTLGTVPGNCSEMMKIANNS